jgi:predicted histone-like DNA-binding protein
MAVLYRLQKNNNPKSTSYGNVYAKAVITDTADLQVLADRIQRNCTAKRSDVLAVLTELVEVMQDELQSGHKVKLDGFGSFKIGIRGTSAESVEKFKVLENVKGLRVNFQPEVHIDTNKKRTQMFLSGCKVMEMPKHTEVTDEGTSNSGDENNAQG